MSDGAAIILTGVSTAIGSAASWLISRWYYRRSGSDLDSALRPFAGDNQKLIKAFNAFGRMFEKTGTGEFSRDAEGNITGLVVRATGHAAGSSSAHWVGGSTYSPPPKYDRQHEQPENSDGADAG